VLFELELELELELDMFVDAVKVVGIRVLAIPVWCL